MAFGLTIEKTRKESASENDDSNNKVFYCYELDGKFCRVINRIYNTIKSRQINLEIFLGGILKRNPIEEKKKQKLQVHCDDFFQLLKNLGIRKSLNPISQFVELTGFSSAKKSNNGMLSFKKLSMYFDLLEPSAKDQKADKLLKSKLADYI